MSCQFWNVQYSLLGAVVKAQGISYKYCIIRIKEVSFKILNRIYPVGYKKLDSDYICDFCGLGEVFPHLIFHSIYTNMCRVDVENFQKKNV